MCCNWSREPGTLGGGEFYLAVIAKWEQVCRPVLCKALSHVWSQDVSEGWPEHLCGSVSSRLLCGS